MSAPPRFPLRAAAALFLERQQLDRPRGRRFTAANVAAFARATGGIQLDSINVVERAHHLTLWSRFGPYARAAFERITYRQRALFEYWAHAACLVAIEDFPVSRRLMLDYGRRKKGWGAFLRKHAKLMRAVEAAITERGPLGNADFEHRAPQGGRGGWWNWKPATHALDYLWMSGRTAVHSRVHFQKRFDLIERVLPEALKQEPLAADEFERWRVRRSLAAMGAATSRDLINYLTFTRTPATRRRAALQELLHAGEVVEVALDGDTGRWFARREDLPALAAAARRRAPSRGATLLSPFDSFLWHRDRVQRLFGFDYRIEVYVPAAKRKYGYYTLPMIVDGHLVGRADAKTHREHGVLELKHVHFERWFAAGHAPPVVAWGALDRDAALAALAAAMRSLATFVGVAEVRIGRVSAPALRRPLLAALDASAAAPPVADAADADEPETQAVES